MFRTRWDFLLLGSYHKCLPNNVLMKGIPTEPINAALAFSRSGTSVLDSVIILKFEGSQCSGVVKLPGDSAQP